MALSNMILKRFFKDFVTESTVIFIIAGISACNLLLYILYSFTVILPRKVPVRVLKIHHDGGVDRLGNVMFAYAGIKGIAFETNRTSVFARKFSQLRTAFSNTRMKLVGDKHHHYEKVRFLWKAVWDMQIR